MRFTEANGCELLRLKPTNMEFVVVPKWLPCIVTALSTTTGGGTGSGPGGGPPGSLCTHVSPSSASASDGSPAGANTVSPPKSTILDSVLSNAIVCCQGPFGPMSWTCVHSLPSHCHVSPKTLWLATGIDSATELTPPKSTMVVPPKTIATPARGSGPVSATCVQSWPSHCQVSPSPPPSVPAPPNRTMRPCFGSYVIPGARRAGGPVSATCVQPSPSHSQVSRFRPEPASPPNSTMRSLTLSYAIACPVRGSGPVSATCVQSSPSHAHVSPNCVPPEWPPNSMTRWREAS